MASPLHLPWAKNGRPSRPANDLSRLLPTLRYHNECEPKGAACVSFIDGNLGRRMFSLPVRILLILATAAYGTYQLTMGKPVGIAFVAAAGLLVFGYFRYGSIRPAFAALQVGDIERVERLLSTIRFPHLLNTQSRAYLHWIRGVLDAQHKDRLASAEDNLRSALNLGVRTSNDRCVLVATMAEVAAKNSSIDYSTSLHTG